MKKNILTIIVMAVSIVNLVLGIVLVFSIVPDSKRTGGKRAGCLDDSYTRKHVQRMEETGTAGTGTLLHADTKSGAHNKGMDILQRCRTDRYY